VNIPSRQSPLRWLLAAAALTLFILLGVTAGPASAARYDQGQRVQVTGLVSDRQGRPLEGIRVTLEVSRTYFSVRQLRKTQVEDVRRVSAVTNAQGEYRVEWPWDSYFNHFEMTAGVAVRKGRTDRVEELAREDVTKRLLGGSPVVVSLVVENVKFLESLRQFLAMVKSEDERRTYDEMGKPDKVQRFEYPDHVEASWWYFESGRVYRFRSGRLEQVVPFTPVPAVPGG
jgi:hypothetical protein